MGGSTKNPKSATPVKDPHGLGSKISENLNPNVSNSSPGGKPINSPLKKSAKSQKSASKIQALNQTPLLYSPRNKLRARKFVVAKKKSKKEKKESNPGVDCKCKERFGGKCLCVAYETLRASQEGFFNNPNNGGEKGEPESEKARDCRAEDEVEEKEIEKAFVAQNLKDEEDGYGSDSRNLDSSKIKRRRDRLLEEARNSVPECGKVMHLVNVFEKLRLMPNSKDSDNKEDEEKESKEDKKKAMQWALPGLQFPKAAKNRLSSSSSTLPEFQPPKMPEMQVSSGSLCPSDLFLTSENLGLDTRFSVSSSWEGSQGSLSSRTSNGGQRSRRNSSDSCGAIGGRRWKKRQLRITSQKPFKLRTEQRGRLKEEEFTKKLQEMMIEEERQRIPIAQGLPWTTDEPEKLIKPPVKDNTRPVDIKLHSDVRAMERAEFDHQIAEKMTLIEQYKMERERQQKLVEEEEIHRLRKELVPKAQPMPYFDRPFFPRRSVKDPTVPREPRFHIPQHKKIKCCLSWNDISTFTYQQQQ